MSFATSNSPILTSNPARALAHAFNVRVFFFWLLHAPLAFVLTWSGWLGLAHVGLATLWGLQAAVRRKPLHVMYAMTYIAGAEVLWRMTRASVPWEHGKYAIALIGLAALLTAWRGRAPGDAHPQRLTPLPILYMFLLLPALTPLLFQSGLAGARDEISFNLSGHLALTIGILYLWRRELNRAQAARLLIVLLAPIIGIAALAVHATLSTELTFVLEGNWVTSGNYGPNQVANMLGLGALAGAMLLLLLPKAAGLRLAIVGITAVFLVQGLLTLSRGGMYCLALAALVLVLHLLRTPKARWWAVSLSLGLYLLGIYVIWPALDNITEGIFSVRISDLDTTGRLESAVAELQAFRDFPLTGAGVGMASEYRSAVLGQEIAAHTEFTRMLAEHGLLGLIAIVILLALLFSSYRRAPAGPSRAIVAALAVWVIAVMLQSAMRFAAIPFVASLAILTWNVDEPYAEQR